MRKGPFFKRNENAGRPGTVIRIEGRHVLVEFCKNDCDNCDNAPRCKAGLPKEKIWARGERINLEEQVIVRSSTVEGALDVTTKLLLSAALLYSLLAVTVFSEWGLWEGLLKTAALILSVILGGAILRLALSKFSFYLPTCRKIFPINSEIVNQEQIKGV